LRKRVILEFNIASVCSLAVQSAARFIYVIRIGIAAGYVLDCPGSNPGKSNNIFSLLSTKLKQFLWLTKPPIQ
jgi:hypothetical protein